MTTMTHWNRRGALARLSLSLFALAPLCACDCDSGSSVLPPGDDPGYGIEAVVVIEPGSGYEVGDPVVFGSGLISTEGGDDGAYVSSVDATGGVTGLYFEGDGQNYLVPPTATVMSDSGEGCVLLVDLRVVSICMDNEYEQNINGQINLLSPDLLGKASIAFDISGICFSEPGLDECFLAVNGTHSLGANQELEVTLFTTSLNEFSNADDHLIMAADEGLLLSLKTDLDRDGDYEISEGEVLFFTAFGGAIQLTSAVINHNEPDTLDGFASGLDGLLNDSIVLSGVVSFSNCE